VTRPTVKALVVHSPYAQEIASGEKRIEYRCWPVRYRGWLAIVAARRRESGTDAGRAVCLVKLVDCVQAGHKDYEWMLESPVPLKERVDIPGRLGIFDVTDQLPASVLALARDGARAKPARKAARVVPAAKPARKARARKVLPGTMRVAAPGHLMYR
jgi:hypothetical protein